jgi:hypothetical protein
MFAYVRARNKDSADDNKTNYENDTNNSESVSEHEKLHMLESITKYWKILYFSAILFMNYLVKAPSTQFMYKLSNWPM